MKKLGPGEGEGEEEERKRGVAEENEVGQKRWGGS